MTTSLPAGRRTARITIYKRAEGQDASGQPNKGLVKVIGLWADFRNSGGLEAIKAGAMTSTVAASARISYRTGLDAGMVLEHAGLIYNIKAVLPDLANREHVDLVCEVTT